MKKKILHLLTLVLAILFFTVISRGDNKPKDKVLIFSKTSGYRHASIKEGIKAIQKLGKANGFEVEATEDASTFSKQNLKGFKAIIFLNPTGTGVFNEEQKAAFKAFINQGGGFVGIHSATDFCYEWEWYGKLVGAYFKNHPAIQEATLNVVSKNHISTKNLPTTIRHKDEWYNFKNLNKDVNVLIEVDESSYKGGENGRSHPISWYHNYDGGRVFYTALGHTKDCYTSDKVFLQHLLGGIKYALGRTK